MRYRRALRNQRLRRNRWLNRFYGPARRTVLAERGLPMYPLAELGSPPVPPIITESEFHRSIAHDIERGRWGYYQCWTSARESTGAIMEYQFRLRFHIPVHLPRAAMKIIFLLLADDDAEEMFGGDGCWRRLEAVAFAWPRPFHWP